MTVASIRAACQAALLGAVLAAAFAPAARALEPVKINAVLSATETKGRGATSRTLTWSMDGEWREVTRSRQMVLRLNSDYSRSENARLDRLRTSFRRLHRDYGKQVHKWYPVYLVQTEGDHGFDGLHTLAAAGFRQRREYGYVEITAGASRDIRGDDEWMGDIGFEFGYERDLGNNWSVRTGPKGELGALGSARLRDDRLRYSWDVNINYQATETLGFGYRLWAGNTVRDSDRTQWVGITYRYRK